MFEPIYTEQNAAALKYVVEGDPYSEKNAYYTALLHRATSLAIESAFRYGRDLPVGAVAANDDWITGRYYASDRRLDWPPMHAERMALVDSMYNRVIGWPHTLVVTLEPCEGCQDFISTRRWGAIKYVGFGVARSEAAERGLVKPHPETAAERVARLEYPFKVFQVEDEALHRAGCVILDHVQRDTTSGQVRVNQSGLTEALIELNVFG